MPLICIGNMAGREYTLSLLFTNQLRIQQRNHRSSRINNEVCTFISTVNPVRRNSQDHIFQSFSVRSNPWRRELTTPIDIK